jgi:hypothetical protein
MLLNGRERRDNTVAAPDGSADYSVRRTTANVAMNTASRITRYVHQLWWLILPLTVGFTTGCYDSDALLKQAQSTALSTSLAEVDLGKFQTTLPRDPETGRFMKVELHIFGTVPRSRLSAVERQLESDEYRVRHETLSAVRQSTREDLADPTFVKLRQRIEQVVNKVLADSPIQEVGFYQLTLR